MKTKKMVGIFVLAFAIIGLLGIAAPKAVSADESMPTCGSLAQMCTDKCHGETLPLDDEEGYHQVCWYTGGPYTGCEIANGGTYRCKLGGLED